MHGRCGPNREFPEDTGEIYWKDHDVFTYLPFSVSDTLWYAWIESTIYNLNRERLTPIGSAI